MSKSSDSSLSTNSSSSPAEKRKRVKSSKKHKKEKKHKKQKKLKKYKSEKRIKRGSSEQPMFSAESAANSFGPALPPHLLKTSELSEKTKNDIIGPVLPNIFSPNANHLVEETSESKIQKEFDEDSNEIFDYGPTPAGYEMNAQHLEREERALQLKIAAIDGHGINPSTKDQKFREEWMLELPDVGLRGGLASLNNMKRTFYTGKDKPDFSDRSSWTKTPQSDTNNSKPSTSKSNAETLKKRAESLYEKARDAEQEELAKKHKKRHKRDESLVELHQKKLRREQKEREKELAASGAKPERRPFSRDVDLKLNKIDKHQTKQIVDKAKILDSKFSSGKTKFL